MAIGYIAFVVSGVFAVIGAIADLFGFAQGVSENKESILGVFYTFLSYLVIWWKWALGIAVVIVAVYFYIRWAQKKEMEDRQTRNLSWFDAQRRNTKYSGGEEHLYKLKFFLKQKDADFLWWAVTGVAGIGKTRLVIEALRDEKITGADIQWLRSFDDYREEALKESVDIILEKSNLRNIIIAEDAQIYMDNIGVLIGYIAEKPVSELGKHKIRLLLLIRMGEDEELKDRYKQLASKTRQSILQKTRFKEFDKELKIEAYDEKDISQIVKTYVVNTNKKRRNEKTLSDNQVAEIQTKTVQTLATKKVDSRHMRPLFAMFIADALLVGKDPMLWNREDILEYAVIEREDEFMRLEARDIQKYDNIRIYDKIKGIVCLSFIRDGLHLSDLDGIKEELEKELQYAGIGLSDFLKEMQMIKGDDIVHISMPDILSEYYVLRYLVIEPDEDGVRWIISQLYNSLAGVEVSRQKIRQDFKYLYSEIEENLDDFYYAFFERCSTDLAFEIIKKLLSEKDLSDSNEILLHEAIGNQIRNKVNEKTLSEMLLNMIDIASEMEEKRSCLRELERLSVEDTGSVDIILKYSQGLVQLLYYTSEIEEKRYFLTNLERLAGENSVNAGIAYAYCSGLVRMIIDSPEIEEKRSCLSKLEHMYGKYTDNADIVCEYSKGLYDLFLDTPEMEEKRSCLKELERLGKKNEKNDRVVFVYSRGLCDALINIPEMEEKRSCLKELERLTLENAGNAHILSSYAIGISGMLDAVSEIEEKRSYLKQLEILSAENAGDTDIVLSYADGLVNMISDVSEMEEKRRCLRKLEILSVENAGNVEIVRAYADGLYNTLYDAPGIKEKRSCLSKLERLLGENKENADIALSYSKGLLIMLDYDEEHYNDYIGELYRTISDKKIAQYILTKEPDIITYTRRELLDYEYENESDGIDTILKGIL